MLRLFPLMALAILVSACPSGGPEPIPDITWDPPLIDDTSGELDFGLVPEGETPQETISGTNNTDDTIIFSIDVDLPSGDPWLYSEPTDDWPVEPGGAVSFGPRFNAHAGAPDESSGTVTFIWGDDLVTYIIRVEVDH